MKSTSTSSQVNYAYFFSLICAIGSSSLVKIILFKGNPSILDMMVERGVPEENALLLAFSLMALVSVMSGFVFYRIGLLLARSKVHLHILVFVMLGILLVSHLLDPPKDNSAMLATIALAFFIAYLPFKLRSRGIF